MKALLLVDDGPLLDTALASCAFANILTPLDIGYYGRYASLATDYHCLLAERPDYILWRVSSLAHFAQELKYLDDLREQLPFTAIAVILEHSFFPLLTNILSRSLEYLFAPVGVEQLGQLLTRLVAKQKREATQRILSASAMLPQFYEQYLLDSLTCNSPTAERSALHAEYLASTSFPCHVYQEVSPEILSQLTENLSTPNLRQLYLLHCPNTSFLLVADSLYQALSSLPRLLPLLFVLDTFLFLRDDLPTLLKQVAQQGAVTAVCSLATRAFPQKVTPLTFFYFLERLYQETAAVYDEQTFDHLLTSLFLQIDSKEIAFLLSLEIVSLLCSPAQIERIAKELKSAKGTEERLLVLRKQYHQHRLQKIVAASESTSYIRQAFALAEENLGNPIFTVGWLCETKLYVNANYFSHQFTQQTGEPFTTYLTRRRIEKAKELLLHPADYKISYIAAAIGSGKNPRYFSQLFKKWVGCSPSAFRQSNQYSQTL